VSTTSELGPGPQPGRVRRFLPLLLRLVRRTHLYLGLLLWPFVLLFGITALSFNHPTVGRGLEMRRLSPKRVGSASGFEGWDPGRIADDVVRRLAATGQRYRLSETAAPRFGGYPLFAAPVQGGKQVLILNLEDGSATLTHRPDPVQPAQAPFAQQTIELESYAVSRLAERLTPILKQEGIDSKSGFRPHPEVHPALHFRMTDAGGQEWNVVYDLSSGELAGRPSAEPPKETLIELLESLHTQHHYPPHPDATTYWAMFADLTALTLITWALTGLVMWWQLRRLRRVGAVVLVAALGLASTVIVSTAREIRFGPAAQEP
jgi:hypothetical protein